MHMGELEYPDFKWPDGARLALSIVVNIEEGAEANVVDGDKYPEPVDELGIALKRSVRNFSNESNYRYGINAGGPRIFDLLGSFDLRATVTGCALALERAPELTRRIANSQHEVCSHGYRWAHQFHMEEDEERAYIRKAVASIQKSVGKRPLGWLSRYLTSDRTRRLLAEEGFFYTMDDYSHDRPFWDATQSAPLVVVPYALDTNDMKFWTDPSYAPESWLAYAKQSFDWLYEEGAIAPRMMSLGVHSRIIGRPGRIKYFRDFLEYVAARPDVWIAPRLEIAQHYASEHPHCMSDV